MKLSIVIPTLNEERTLRNTVLHTKSMHSGETSLEIIVVDNGSVDNTLHSIKDQNVRCFEKPELKGRKYAVLNFGYQQANGEVIVFLDADTLLPHHFDLLIKQCLVETEVVGGAFNFRFQERKWYLQLLAWANRLRIRWDYNFLGDQAVFCRKIILDQVGGYPEKLIMESSHLCRKLRKQGKLKLIPACVRTSGRRFLEGGFLGVFWYDLRVWVNYLIGADTDKFGESYWKHNDTSNGH